MHEQHSVIKRERESRVNIEEFRFSAHKKWLPHHNSHHTQ